MRALADEFRIGRSTVYKIIDELCEAVSTSLTDTYLATPTPETWTLSELEFQRLGFPHAIGAIDGKNFWCRVSFTSPLFYLFNF
jgi:hypothetical protein